MINKLFNYIIENAETTSKKSVIDYFSKKDKVYTKKIPINGDKIVIDGCKVKYLSITSISDKFEDSTPYDIRVNLKNPFGMWVNVYLTSIPEHYIKEIYNRLGL